MRSVTLLWVFGRNFDAFKQLRCVRTELYFFSADAPYVFCYEEVGYERRFGEILAHISRSSEDDCFFVLDNGLHILSSCDQFHAVAIWAHWVRDIDLECSMCSSRRCMFFGWQNVEAFSLPPQQREEFYVSHPAWWLPYMYCRLISVPWPSIIAIYSFIVLQK